MKTGWSLSVEAGRIARECCEKKTNTLERDGRGVILSHELTKDPSVPTVVKLQVPTFLMMASTSATRSFNVGVWSSDFLEYLKYAKAWRRG